MLGRPFIVRTDQDSLKFLLEQRIATPTQQKWLFKLMGYAFMVEYNKGTENKLADALFRQGPLVLESGQQQDKSARLFLVSLPDPTWLSLLKDSYHQDAFAQQLFQSHSAGESLPKGFLIHNGLLFYKGMLHLESHCSLKSQILHFVHSSPIAGHSGFLKSFQRAKKDFFWQGMQADLKVFIKECDVFQIIKSETSSPALAYSYHSLD